MAYKILTLLQDLGYQPVDLPPPLILSTGARLTFLHLVDSFEKDEARQRLVVQIYKGRMTLDSQTEDVIIKIPGDVASKQEVDFQDNCRIMITQYTDLS